MKAEDFLDQEIEPVGKKITSRGMPVEAFLDIPVEEPIGEPAVAGTTFVQGQPPTMLERGKEAVTEFFRPSFAPEPEPERIPFPVQAPTQLPARAPTPPSPKIPAFEYEDIIGRASKAHDVDPDLIRAVIDIESSGKPAAVSGAGAGGLMQLMPATAKELGVTDRFDPEQNITGGAKYLRKMLDRFDGNETLALAAYNAGAGNVTKYGGIPPFKETQNYVKKVTKKYKKYQEDRRKAVEPVTDSAENFLAADIPGQMPPSIGLPEIGTRRTEINKRLEQISAETITDNIESLQTQLEGISSQAVDGALPPDLYEQYTALRPQYEKAVEDYNAGITEAQGLTGELEDLKQMEYGAEMTRPISTITGKPVPLPRRPAQIFPEEQKQVLPALRKGLAHGLTGLAGTVGTGLEYAGTRTGLEPLKEIGKTTREYWEEKEKGLGPTPYIQGAILEKPELMTRGAWWAYNLADMTPSFAAMMIPGIGAARHIKLAGQALKLTPKVIERLSRIGALTTAGAVGGGMEGAGTYQEILNRGGSDEDAAAGMEAMTLAAGALNSIGFSKITGKLGAKKSNALMRFLKAGSWEGFTEYLEEPAEVLIKRGILPDTAFNKDAAIEQLKQGVNVIPIAGVMGGTTSAITGRVISEPEIPPTVPPGVPPAPAAPGLSETQRELAKEVIREKMAEQPLPPAIPEEQIPLVPPGMPPPGMPPAPAPGMLPPGQGFEFIEPAPEVRLRPGPERIEGPEYPPSVEYVAGRPAPEELEVEYKPILGPHGLPWKEEGGALKAFGSKRLKDMGITEETHEVVPVKNGFGVARKAVEVPPVKEEIPIEPKKPVVEKPAVKPEPKKPEVRVAPKKEPVVEIAGEGQIYKMTSAKAVKYENTDLFLSPELEQLHNHRARVLGFEKAGGSFVEGYLTKLAEVAEKTDMPAAMATYKALSEYKKGNVTQATLDAEKILGKLHKEEVKALTHDRIIELHKQDIRKALKSGKLTPEKYAELHEKDYGPLAEFMPEAAKAPPEVPEIKEMPEVPKILKVPEKVVKPVSEKPEVKKAEVEKPEPEIVPEVKEEISKEPVAEAPEKQPAIVTRVLEDAVASIGQLSPDDVKVLNKAVKDGVLEKAEAGPYPKPKTVYAKPGYDFKREREKALEKLKKPIPEVVEKPKAVPLDIEGNELVDMDDVPMEVNPDGTVTLYHRTTTGKAENLKKTGKFRSLENTNETFFSNKFEGQAVGYGEAVITVKVKPSKTRLDDAFHGGEVTVAVSNKFLSKANIVEVEPITEAEIVKPEPLSETKSRLLENIKSEKGSSELINDLSRLGADAMRRGHTTYKAFTAEMKTELSSVWEKIKSLIRKAFFRAKQILKSEKGAVELRNPFASQVTDESPSGMSLFDDLEVERTYAQKINTERDEAVYQVDRRALELERQVKELTGTGRRKGVIGRRISAERIKFSEFRARQLSRAMLYYREAQINPEKAEEFEGWAVKELETAKGERKIRIKAQLATYRQSQNLTDEQKRFVDETMDQAFSDVSDEAIKSGIITRTKENYVRRIWNLSKNRAGLAKYGFKTFTTAQLQRKFETIYDGFVRDMDLKVSGIVSSYGEIAGEVAVIKANKNFIQASMDIGILTTDSKKPGYIPLNASGFSAWARKAGAKIKTRPDEPGLLQIDTHGRKIFFAPPTLKYGAIKPGATRVSRYFPTMEMAEEWIEERDEPYRIDRVQQADVFEKVTLYAPERIGEMLNQMTRTAGGMFETPVMRSLLRFNAGIKGWILMSSFFHHMAGQRSWAFGVNHEIKDNLGKGNIVQAIKNVGTMVNSVSAHKRGLQKIEANSAQLALLVKQGLTLGKMQDWDEALLREQKGLTETFIHTLGAERIAGVMEKGRIKREMFTNSLFRRFFAGLKAEAAVTEFNYRVKRATMKGKTPDTNLIAEQVARLINADFGGLHLTRMGRSKDMQKMLRLLLLAPDWTESNFRTFTGMIPGANKTINRMIGDMPPPPGMEKVYRGFWGGVIIKGTLATMMVQAVADLWNDDDEGWRKDEFFNNFRRMKWTGVNVTGLYRSLGVDVSENERRIFSVVGHFADPLKIMHPPKLIKGKGSPLTRIAEAAMSKSDWRERPYTNFGEWAATGKLKKKSRYEPRENFWVALPSIAIDQTISMQPIQFGHLLRYWMGEEDGLSALLSSGGAHITTAYKPRKPKPGRGPLKSGLSGGRLRGRLKGRLQ